jgi:hypothetical protein
MKVLERKKKRKKKYYALECPLVCPLVDSIVSGIHSTNQMWSDNTKPELKEKKGNDIKEDTSNECVQQISQKNASIQSTMLLLTLRDVMHLLLVSNYPYPKPPNPILSHYARLDLTLQSYPYFLVHFCSWKEGD